MKRLIKITLITLSLLYASSCTDYLDIVPDNTVTLEDYFERREMAWNALCKVYSYLPQDYLSHHTSWSLGDEWMGQIEMENNESYIVATRIMRGLQNTNNPILGHWTGTFGGRPLYQGIRSANIFLKYIDMENMAEDMSELEIKEWKAQVQVLKAYFHFLLLRQYGPIVIMDDIVPLDALSEDLFQKRSKVEDCFNYIIDLMNKAIPDIDETADENELGLITRPGAAAIKARVMLFRASPFFNGNTEYYGDFFDFDGEPFFPMQYDNQKWKDAVDAADEAIELCLANDHDLYTFDDAPFSFDRDDFEANPDLQTLYDLRMSIVDPWNKELLWGQTYNPYLTSMLSHDSNIRLPLGYFSSSTPNDPTRAGQWMGASYRMLERYYTKNGLPIEEDRTFNRTLMHTVLSTPGANAPGYDAIQGLMQPGEQTIQLYLNRELRFYANLGITGGYWRAHVNRVRTTMLSGGAGGLNGTYRDDYFCTGVGVQKFVHPESKAGDWYAVVKCPYPIIRMADLYLMKAEALNEYRGDKGTQEGPNEEIWEAVNKIRRRAGLRTVQETWSDAQIVRPAYQDKHLKYEGMKEIILRERSIELAFEGSRFWDMHRHKRAVGEFSSPIMGWKATKASVSEFFVLEQKQARRFIVRDYLWPISLSEINKNANLIQNPGW
jgi:hypothetical protein